MAGSPENHPFEKGKSFEQGVTLMRRFSRNQAWLDTNKRLKMFEGSSLAKQAHHVGYPAYITSRKEHNIINLKHFFQDSRHSKRILADI